MAMNLRGIRESGTFFAIPTYAFMVAILGMCALRLAPAASPATCPRSRAPTSTIAPGAGLRAAADDDRADVPAGPGVLVRLCRADRRRGDLQRRAGVPQAEEQERRDHAAAARPDRDHDDDERHRAGQADGPAGTSTRTTSTGSTRNGEPLPADYDQHTVIAQIARAVFNDFPPGFYFVVTVTGVILVLAANTAFNGFPVLGSILAQDGSRRARSARAATGWPTATASCSWP